MNLRKKRPLALLLAFTMLFSLSAGSAGAAVDYDGTSGSANDYFLPIAEKVDSFAVQSMPCYVQDPNTSEEISVGFLNGMTDIPYLSLDTIADLLDESYLAFGDYDDTYSLDVGPVDDAGKVFALVRENDSTMVVDFNSSKITFTDIGLFTANPDAANALDCVSTTGNGGQTLINHTSMFYRAGHSVIVDLAHYGIPAVMKDGVGYLPMQTVADLLFDRVGLLLLYNGKSVIVADSIEYPFESDDSAWEDLLGISAMEGAENTESTEAAENTTTAAPAESAELTLSDLYYDADRGTKSDALTTFTYNELCLAMDYNYGLQNEHDITSFNEIFIQSGLKDKLTSKDAGQVFLGLTDLCASYFGDSHSGTNSPSWMTDLDPNSKEVVSAQMGNMSDSIYNMMYYSMLRDHFYPDGPVGYEEVGDTAYITFDTFSFDPDRDYYHSELTNNPEDTYELIMYAHQQICRENSPVKNVVIDLSNNGGGYADAAACVLSWMLGGATINLVDPISGAQSSNRYEFDTNRDGSFDSVNDSLAYSGRKLFCIISPNSFSCGNLVPYMLEDSNRVTLIGRSSTGGACVVESMSTADGNLLQISGPERISTVYNGSYYSVDEGVDPDIYITDLTHLYDRAYLTNVIDQLP